MIYNFTNYFNQNNKNIQGKIYDYNRRVLALIPVAIHRFIDQIKSKHNHCEIYEA